MGKRGDKWHRACVLALKDPFFVRHAGPSCKSPPLAQLRKHYGAEGSLVSSRDSSGISVPGWSLGLPEGHKLALRSHVLSP